MAGDGKQPAREVLRADAAGAGNAQARNARLEEPDGRDREDSSSLAGRIVMVFLNRFISGLRRLFHAAQTEQELDEEVRAYLETAVEQKMSGDMTREAAVRAARVEIGSLEAVKDRARDVGWESSVETFWRDAGHALRRLRKSPGFAFAAIGTLALSIGANTAIFSVLHATSLGSSAFRDPDRLAMIWTTPAGHPEASEGARIVEYLTWKEQSQTFDHVGTMLGWSGNLGSMR